MFSKAKKVRVINGKVHALYGGYVSYDGRKPAGEQYPIRRCIEVKVWLVPNFDETDCGYGTDKLVKALEQKVLRSLPNAHKRNVSCRESWRY